MFRNASSSLNLSENTLIKQYLPKREVMLDGGRFGWYYTRMAAPNILNHMEQKEKSKQSEKLVLQNLEQITRQLAEIIKLLKKCQ